MAYQAFQQLHRPNVNISLFGEAATRGAAVGNAIPTDTTAAIRGVQEGIDRGLNTIAKIENIETANIQQEAARARLPYEGDIARERAEGMELNNEMRQIQIEDARANQQERQNLQASQIETTETALDAKKEQLDRERQFLGQFRNANAQQQIGMVLGGQYSDVFARNKNIYTQALDTIYMNPDITAAQKDAIDKMRKRSGAIDYYERKAHEDRKKFIEAKENLYSSPLTSEILSNTSGMLPEDVPGKVEFIPAGKYQLTEDGSSFKIDPKTGRRQLSEQFDPEEVSDKYIVALKGSNQIVGHSANKQDFDAYKNYLAQLRLQDGTYGKIAADRLTEDPQPTGQPTGQPKPRVDAPAGRTGESAEVSMMKQNLNLTDADYIKLRKPLQTLKELSSSYVDKKRSVSTASLRKVEELTQTKDTIANYIVNDEWDNSEAIRTRYTESDVEEYNNQIEREMKAALGITAVFTAGKGAILMQQQEALAAPLKVTSPQNLYYIQRRKVIDKQINDLFRDLIEYEKQRRSTRARSAQGTQQIIQRLKAAQNGTSAVR